MVFRGRLTLVLDQASHWCAGLLGAIFIVAAAQKIKYPFEFLSGVYGYGLVGREFGMLLAVSLPWLELLLGILLLLQIWILEALLVSAGLLACFTCIQMYAVVEQLNIACSCFGDISGDSGIGLFSIVRTTLLACAALFPLAVNARKLVIPKSAERLQPIRKRAESDDGEDVN